MIHKKGGVSHDVEENSALYKPKQKMIDSRPVFDEMEQPYFQIK
jgi:hypothetical protein